MTNMNDQYTNKSDNKVHSNDDVEDIDPGDKLVDYFNNGNNYNNDDDNTCSPGSKSLSLNIE